MAKKKKTLTQKERKFITQIHSDFRKKWNAKQRELVAQTTLEQRRIFIEAIRQRSLFYHHISGAAMKAAGIESLEVANAVFLLNSRKVEIRELLPPEKVR